MSLMQVFNAEKAIQLKEGNEEKKREFKKFRSYQKSVLPLTNN